MEINFSPAKIWNDLVESKERLKYLYQIIAILMVLNIFDAILHVKIFGSIGNLFLYAYFTLMANNIIQDRKPILEDLGKSGDDKRNIFLVTLKGIGISLVYGIGLAVLILILFLTFSKVLMLNKMQLITLSIILLLPFMILMSIINLLFAETLNFGDAFNIKKALESFKLAWGKYLAIFGINILLVIVLFVLLMLILMPIGISLVLALKSYPAIALTKELGALIGRILGSIFGTIGAVIIQTWYMNASAQVYKYSLTKM